MNTTIKKEIKQLIKKPLSVDDVKRICDYKTTFVTYPELNNVKDIDDILNKHGSVLILYLQSPTFGHWCVLNKINDKLIEFFDPYGYFVDNPLKYNDKARNMMLKQKAPYLSKLLIKSKYDLSYNEHPFQTKKYDINTCGRHCGLRIKYKSVTLNNYKKMFDSVKKYGTPDEIVTVLTYDI